MTNRPLFVALPAPDKFWREYRIYEDRVELETVLGVLTIPFDDIDHVAGTPIRDDAAEQESARSLVIDRKQGWLRRVCIRPREASGFRRALETALTRHRAISPDH